MISHINNGTTALPPNMVWRSIAAGSEHSLALDFDGRIWAWGSNGNGRLGIGTIGTIGGYSLHLSFILKS